MHESILNNYLALLDENQRDAYKERAAIMQFEANMPKAVAEGMALLEVIRRYPEILTRLHCLEIELDGETQWVIAVEPTTALPYVRDIGGTVKRTTNLAAVVEVHFGGLARLIHVG